MFLHRLGRAYGIIDIDLLDDSITDEQLTEHQAAFWIDGIYHGRTQTAEIVSEVRNLGNTMIAAQATEPTVVADELTWHTPASIIKQRTKTDSEPTARKMIPANQMFAEIERRYG